MTEFSFEICFINSNVLSFLKNSNREINHKLNIFGTQTNKLSNCRHQQLFIKKARGGSVAEWLQRRI